MTIPSTRATFKEYCLKNKYSKWYFNIIDMAIIRNWKKNKEQYLEKHHIIPRAITEEKKSQGEIVFLTAKEHFICHLLLPKMIEDKKIKGKMILALHRLITGNKKNYCLSSRTYENIKKYHKIAASQRSKDYWLGISKEERSNMRIGKKNPRYGIILTEKTKEKISNANKGKLSKDKHPLWKIGHSKESIDKMKKNAGKSALGKNWFNNGVENFLLFHHENKNNLNIGRINMKVNEVPLKALLGKKWYNNGIKEILIFPKNQKQQYKLGRIKHVNSY